MEKYDFPSILKNSLRKLPFYNTLIPYYHIIKNPSLWKMDLLCRIKKPPDGYPLPPSKLIYLVVGKGSPTGYFTSGKNQALLIKECLKHASINISDFSSILDFGCGCGRLIRHFNGFHGKLSGCDYNPVLVNWCRTNLPFAEFFVNNLNPPTLFKENSFDFIYQISVFTHMSASLQIRWMDEFDRILTDKGILFFTTHGNHFMGRLSQEEQESYHAGNLVTKNLEFEGKNLMGSYESFTYVERYLLPNFELLSYSPGSDYFPQDIYIVRKKQL